MKTRNDFGRADRENSPTPRGEAEPWLDPDRSRASSQVCGPGLISAPSKPAPNTWRGDHLFPLVVRTARQASAACFLTGRGRALGETTHPGEAGNVVTRLARKVPEARSAWWERLGLAMIGFLVLGVGSLWGWVSVWMLQSVYQGWTVTEQCRFLWSNSLWSK